MRRTGRVKDEDLLAVGKYSCEMEIRPARVEDAAQIASIYNYEVLNSTVTLEIDPRTTHQQERWIARHSGVHQALVAVEDDVIIGYASLSSYKLRAGYNTTVEDSIYLHHGHRRMGTGKLLLSRLLDVAAVSGFHTCMARIVVGNIASIELHKSVGFQAIGIEKEVGRKFSKWLDVMVMQKMLN